MRLRALKPLFLCSIPVFAAFIGPRFISGSGAQTQPNPPEVVSDREAQESAALQQGLNPEVIETTAPQKRKQRLGKLLFFDANLSINHNEACSDCHSRSTGWTSPNSHVNATTVVFPGSIPGMFGNRKPSSAAYASYSPVLHFDPNLHRFIGGNFWDQRATGRRLGSPVADQAQAPLLNSLEMGFSDSACVVYRVSNAKYRHLFDKTWNEDLQDIDWPANIDQQCGIQNTTVDLDPLSRDKVQKTFDDIALSLAAFESSPAVNAFTSKFDAFMAGNATLTADEQLGYQLFQGKGKCSGCHAGSGQQPLFTDFSSANLGVPANPDNPYYKQPSNSLGRNWIDLGLGGFLDKVSDDPQFQDWTQYIGRSDGKVLIPTLRNVDKRPSADFVKAYGHNGYFKSLKEVVHFYNTRDVLPRCDPGDQGAKVTCWPAAEESANETTSIGNLGLTSDEEDAIVAFLRTLSDGYTRRTDRN